MKDAANLPLNDMDINEEELNNMVTAAPMESPALTCANNPENEHLQIKIQFSLSGEYINKTKITEEQMREEQVQEFFRCFEVSFETYQ